MSRPVRHVVFNPSGAETLREALRTVGHKHDVVSLVDDLSFGPIDSLDASRRGVWVTNELGWDDWVAAGSFWEKALSPDHRTVAWLTRRSAAEFAGFLAWVSLLGDAPADIVDMTDIKVSRHADHGPPWPPILAMSLATIPPQEILDNGLIERCRELQQDERDHYQSLWRTLRAENAPLRVIKNGALVSAPISFFDDMLVSFAKRDWQKVARIVGHALAAQMDDQIHQAGDVFLAARINDLVETGRLEVRGSSPLNMRESVVRLPG